MVSEERETNDRSTPNLSRLGSMGLKLQGWRSLLMIWLVWLGLGVDRSVEEWIARADQALYCAKRNGRNCVPRGVRAKG